MLYILNLVYWLYGLAVLLSLIALVRVGTGYVFKNKRRLWLSVQLERFGHKLYAIIGYANQVAIFSSSDLPIGNLAFALDTATRSVKC